jgi:hypothetical protein
MGASSSVTQVSQLLNPYIDFFRALPASCQRDPSVPISDAELLAPEWLVFKAAIAKHFAWAVPTDEAVAIIRKHVNSIVEVGAGSGYWTWLMRQAGITVAAFDLSPPTFTWSDVRRGDERVVQDHPEKALFLCWPPWATGMASGALSAYEGDHIVYVGEWMGGSADPYFFALLVSCFECIDSVAIPQWYMRDDQLMVFRRRRSCCRLLGKSRFLTIQPPSWTLGAPRQPPRVSGRNVRAALAARMPA